MSHFKSNLELLWKVSEPLAAKMEAYYDNVGAPTKIGMFNLEPSRGELTTVRYENGEQSFFLHSPYDPAREAEQYAKAALEGAGDGNFNVFFGMGLGYGVQEVLRQLPADHRAFVFEPHWDLFYLAFCHADLSTMLTRPQTTVTCDPSVQGAMTQYMNLFELASFKGVRMFSNPTFDRLPGAEYFDEFAQRIRYEITAVGGNVQTLMVMGEMQQMNIILNFPHVLDNPPFAHLISKFAGKPAIIVSAGPSLDKNMHLLTEAYDRALIIAVDTAVKPLLAKGILPHVVVTGDPQEENARHLKGVDLPETYFIVEPQCPVAAVNRWSGPKFICTFHDNMMRWVDRVLGDRGRVVVWGSVAVMAYDVAVKLGADPIVFIGQDLSFPEGKTYTSGTIFETEDKQEMSVAELTKRGTTLIDQTDIYGNTVKTNRQMFAYFNFLKNRFQHPEVANRTIINASEGGILQSERVTVLPLRETIDQYMASPFDVREILDKAQRAGNPINYTNLLIELDTLIVSFRESLEFCEKGIEAVKLTLAAIEADEGTTATRRAVIENYNRMIHLRKQLARNREAEKMIELANQSGIFSFAQGVKSIKMPEDGPNNEFMKRSCYHYHTLYVSTRDAVMRIIPPFEAARETARQQAEKAKVPVAG